MNSAEFKTIRESLGLTPQWVAHETAVKLITVQHWETGRERVPNEVAELLESIDKNFDFVVSQAIAKIDELINQGSVPEIALIRYRSDDDLWRFQPDMKPLPASSHAAMLARLRRLLWIRGVPSIIEYMYPEEYFAWLSGREDSEAERCAWALSLQDLL